MLADNGTECLKLPARSPDLNAYAERLVLSIKSECLNKIVPLGQNHLPRAVCELSSTITLSVTTKGSTARSSWDRHRPRTTTLPSNVANDLLVAPDGIR